MKLYKDNLKYKLKEMYIVTGLLLISIKWGKLSISISASYVLY